MSKDESIKIAIEIGPSDTLSRISRSSIDKIHFVPSLKMNENSLQRFNSILSRVDLTEPSFVGDSRTEGTMRMQWRWRGSKEDPQQSSQSFNKDKHYGIMNYNHLLPLVRSAVLGVLSTTSGGILQDRISFLALGLDSLGALALRNSVAKLSGQKNITSSDIFDHPTVQSLTEYLVRQSPDSAMHLSTRSMLEREVTEYDPILKDTNCDFDALHMQRNMIYHTVASPHLKSFIETFHWQFESDTSTEHLFDAWCDTVMEHDSLRLSFNPFAVPLPTQRIWKFSALDHIHGPAKTSEWFKVYDFEVSDVEQYEDCVRDSINRQREYLFDIESPSMYSLFILNFTGSYCGYRQIFLLSIHHLLVDGISIVQILRSLDQHYIERLSNPSGTGRVIPNNSYRYAVLGELDTPKQSMEEAKKYWSTLLSGYSFASSFLYRPLPVIDAVDGEVMRFKAVLQNLHHSFVQASKQMEVTVAALYNALWSITFSLFVDSNAVVYGNVSSGRTQPWLDEFNAAHIVGPMIKTFPVATKLDAAMSLSHIVKSMYKQLYESTTNEFVPLSEIQELVGSSRSLFHLIFDFQPEVWNYSSPNSRGLFLGGGFLIDRIGCPLSVRVLVDGEDIQLHLTSECKSYDLEFLCQLCTAYEEILTGFSQIVQKFDSYDVSLDEFLSQSSTQWILLRKETSSKERNVLNIEFSSIAQVKEPLDSHRLLNELFTDLSIKNDGTVNLSAVISMDENGDEVNVTYYSLNRISRFIANNLQPYVLKHKRMGEDCVIAVVMEKGWEQVAAVLAVHRVQCAYLPIDARLWPEQRVKQVLRLSGAIAVVTQASMLTAPAFSWLSNLENDEHIPVVSVPSQPPVRSEESNGVFDDEEQLLRSIPRSEPKDLAYLIYTSGSTGVPKGVCCHHLGASNTVDDINDLLSVGPEDRVLALSSLSFDLSVYDIFGPLSRGGAIVIPHPESISPPDPAEWLELLEAHHVTIWNTVPAFMELLISHLEFVQLLLPSSLRAVMLSGDWIPLNLPSRIWRCCAEPEKLRVISLGGATEASIWSNIFELSHTGTYGEDLVANDSASSAILGIPPGWSSIPYGYPLRNQSMLILNERMEHCEVCVTGMIYIGGVGVARGYHRDPNRSALSFVRHPITGETLFRTGDLGRVRPGGILEILGREDSQVKLNGYRIELGEIEKVLAEHPLVRSAAVTVKNNSLQAFVVKRGRTNGNLSEDECSSLEVENLSQILRNICVEKLTEYMVPQTISVIDYLPLSPNGKVLRNKLESNLTALNVVELESVDEKLSNLESTMIEIWAEILNIPKSGINVTSNFFFLGGDSLKSLRLVAHTRRQGIIISVSQIFDAPTVRELSNVATLISCAGPEILGTSREYSNATNDHIFKVNEGPNEETLTYPLIGINQAHFVGLHTSSYARNGMTPQIYFEWEISAHLDVELLERAVNAFIVRHETFRSVVTAAGKMVVLTDIPRFRIKDVNNWLGSEEQSALSAAFYRKDMMENGPGVFNWPLFDIRVSHVRSEMSLVHVNVSLFLMDAMSDLILRQEISALYRAGAGADLTNVLPAPSSLLFREYCTAMENQLSLSSEYQKAKEYWSLKLNDLSNGPEIPQLVDSANGSTGKFCNQHKWLSRAEWKRARKNCQIHSVTMPTVLLTAYALTLHHWCQQDHFLINILQCLRHQVHPDVNKMVGNCSSTILCDVDLKRRSNESLSFRQIIRRLATELSRNLEHAVMSGVDVMQELNRLKGNTFKPVAPFIFTTPIGVEQGNKQVQSRNWVFQERFFSERVPHTACVNAIKEDPSGTACASLDIVEDVFPAEVVKGLYSTYSIFLELICSKDSSEWDKDFTVFLPQGSLVRSQRPSLSLSPRLLTETILNNRSDSTAVLYKNKDGNFSTVSYGVTYNASKHISNMLMVHVLQYKRMGEDCVIAVVMEKGWEQVAAVLAVHRVQCAYLPIDARLWPEQRVKQVLRLSGAIAVVTQASMLTAPAFSWLSNLENDEHIPVVSVPSQPPVRSEESNGVFDDEEQLLRSIPRSEPKDLAYLIYTSGSTGVPKGVCCHHLGASNTVDDINDLLSVGPEDRVLALSSLSFDLSVYDIFGPLSRGGAIVIPHPESISPPDPAEWLELLEAHHVTIWNTVPAFMELLISHLEFVQLLLPSSLRAVMLSGDWIPLNLPSRIWRCCAEPEKLRVISLGGATEASIWSNIFELSHTGTYGEDLVANDSASSAILGIPPGWSSIPYGYPLRNQSMLILNERMEHCEVCVTGMIYIGGVGVARGYHRDPNRSALSFVRHPITGETLFRTGDLGRVRPGGILEILGREDSQVKLNGYRIELGEIEKVLAEHPLVSSTTVTVHNQILCAYFVRKSTGIKSLNSENKMSVTIDNESLIDDLKKHCMSQLTDYMIPRHFIELESIPLSPNGKVVRSSLPLPRKVANGEPLSLCSSAVAPLNETELIVRNLFATILGITERDICCEKTTFFEMGGNSLLSIQLLFRIREQFKVNLGIQDLFASATVRKLGMVIASRSHSDVSAKRDRITVLQLQKGAAGSVPIFLVNPAGASGLW